VLWQGENVKSFPVVGFAGSWEGGPGKVVEYGRFCCCWKKSEKDGDESKREIDEPFMDGIARSLLMGNPVCFPEQSLPKKSR
jgi:hypothetical protein